MSLFLSSGRWRTRTALGLQTLGCKHSLAEISSFLSDPLRPRGSSIGEHHLCLARNDTMTEGDIYPGRQAGEKTGAWSFGPAVSRRNIPEVAITFGVHSLIIAPFTYSTGRVMP